MEQEHNDQLITLQELASILNVHPQTIYTFIKNKEIPFYQLGEGGTYRFNKQAVLDALAKSSIKQA